MMTLWKGLGGSYIEYDSFCFLSIREIIPSAEIISGGLNWEYTVLQVRWADSADFGSSPPFTLWSAASSSQRCKHSMGRSTLKVQEEKRHCVSRERTETKPKKKRNKENYLLFMAVFSGRLLVPDWGEKTFQQTTVVGVGLCLTTWWCYSLTVKRGPSQ